MKVNSPRFQRATTVVFIIALAIHCLDFFWYDLFPIKSNLSAKQREQVEAEWKREDSLLASVKVIPEGISYDLNQIDLEQLLGLGLDSFIAQRIIRFRNVIGGYRSLDQLLKVYGLDSAEVLRIKPHLYIKEQNLEKQEARDWNLSPFDPNTASGNELVKLGFTKKEVRGVIAYRQRFRPFKSKEDLYQVYNLDSSMIKPVLPFVQIAADSSRPRKDSLFVVVDLNQADSNQLKQLPGIGSYYAKEILKFRESLGGFHHTHQLLELYFLDSTWLEDHQDHITLSGSLKTLNINDLDLDNLVRHPYISYYLARNLIEFRERIGLFKKVEELMNIELVDAVLFRKLAPYLKVKEKPKIDTHSQKKNPLE